MKLMNLLSVALVAAITSASAVGAEEGVQDLKIGDAAPDFALPGIDGKTHRLAEYKGGKVLVIIFRISSCVTRAASMIRSTPMPTR